MSVEQPTDGSAMSVPFLQHLLGSLPIGVDKLQIVALAFERVAEFFLGRMKGLGQKADKFDAHFILSQHRR